MAALASLRCNQKLKIFYDRLIANHKPPKVALVAVMGKLPGFLFMLLLKIMLFGIKIMLIHTFFIDSYYGCLYISESIWLGV